MQAKCNVKWHCLSAVSIVSLSTGTHSRPTTPYSSLSSADAGPRTVTAGHCSCPSNRLTLRLDVASLSNASSRVQTLLFVRSVRDDWWTMN